ncbi:MAG: hypothetical protein NWR72_15955 [Bacteroidia bacterium]|nr:hypothetical protein [Bacteroidia bacterium]
MNIEIWEGFLTIASACYKRITRNITLEEFEDAVSNISWPAFQNEEGWLSLVSGLLGLVYVHEDQKDQMSKSRIWLDQAIKTGAVSKVLVFIHAQAYYYQLIGDPGNKIEQIIEEIRSESKEYPNETTKKVYYLASLEIESMALNKSFENFNDSYTKFEKNHKSIVDFDSKCRSIESMPSGSVAFLEAYLAELHASLYDQTQDQVEKQGFADRAQKYFDRAIQAAESMNDPLTLRDIRLKRAEVGVATNVNVTEKEMKEILALYKKSQDFNSYAEAVGLYMKVLAKSSSWAKLFDQIIDLLKFGAKQKEENGFFLQLSAMQLANHYFLAETIKPGVSWMVDLLDDYFKIIAGIIVDLKDQEEVNAIGKSQFDQFRALFGEFEPASHFNIYVYYRYQYQSLNVMRLSLKQSNDSIGLSIANRLIGELEDECNPLSIIRAEWGEFKDVPNFVRNNTLNKCISISKGDLPKAADLMEFSYRNLRSYITFQEVNRLGFFLELQDTNNRQLELGIRLLFHDLYKQGTIFEVVFDMPKFLVQHAQSGFYSLDLEEALDIKGTTAKKYIKIMMGVDMIRQEKIPGRKHFYRLQRENVMKRLGKDQQTLIG